MKFIIFIVAAVVIITIAGLLYFYQQDNRQPDVIAESNIHYYENPEISLKNVLLKVIYFVPKNRTESISAGWKEDIEESLKDLKEFHEFQFGNFSNLNFDVYPRPVISLEDSLFYDSEKTDRGNPNALRAIDKEIEERMFAPEGDLFGSDFSKSGGGYTVNIYIYEGVGASAAREPNGAVILSVDYLRRKDLREAGTTIFYHEITHVFGMPDKYDYDSGAVYSNDIMGGGRRKPLKYTYIADETKKKMGL